VPKYQDSFKYLAIGFPMCLYESKMSMVISKYLKVLREERGLLIINLLSLGLSVLVSLFTIYYMKNLDLAVLSIIFLVGIRSIMAEIFICKKLKIEMGRSIFFEIFLTIGFVASCWSMNYVSSFIGYFLIFLLFLVFNYKSSKHTVINFRNY